jgi:hypothetical protein
LEYGFEYVDSEAKGKNEFGEEMGVRRVEDALKANEWEGGDMDGFGLDDEDDEFGEFGDGGGLDAEEREMGQELFGMKNAIHGLDEDDGEEREVEELESLMRRMVAIKGMSPYCCTDSADSHQKRANPCPKKPANASPRKLSTT